jgi:hypothetical protein
MKKILLSVIALAVSLSAFSQDETADTLKPWTKGALLNVNLSQAAFHNWTAGGENSIAGNLLFAGFADLKKDKHFWNNGLMLGLGYSRIGDKNTKTNDNLEINSLYGIHAFGKNWYYSAILNFKTQFINGYVDSNPDSTLVSGFLSPGYLNIGLGLNYNLNDVFIVNIAPLDAKMIFVTEQELANHGDYGVEAAVLDTAGNIITPGKNMRFKFGVYVRAIYNYEVAKNVTVFTSLDLFSNYLEKPQNIDVNWTVLLAFKINNWLTASINTVLIYDADVTFERANADTGKPETFGPAVQFKEVFNIGLAFNFGDKFKE